MEQFIWYLKYYVIPILLCSTLAFIFLLFLKRIYFQYHKGYRHSISKKIHSFLTEIVLSSPDKDTLKELVLEFRSEIPFNRSWCKEMVIQDMIHLQNNLRGKPIKNITLIYKVLKLNVYSAGLIKDFRNYKKCEGFYHFQSLNYKSGVNLISKYLTHPNKIIRSNANIAYLSITKGDWQAVDTLPVQISILNTIKVMDVFYHQRLPMPKNVNLWIESKNKTILKLAIMTMVFFNYRNRSKEIIDLLESDNIPLKIDVIIAIRELFLNEAEDKLLNHLEFENTEVQLEILKSLFVIGTQKTIDFLKNNINIESDNDLKLKMVKCLNKLDPKLLDQLALENTDTQKMIRHVRETRL